MAPPKKPNKDSKRLHKTKKKKKKIKNKVNKTVPVDNNAIDSEWWDIFWKKNSPNPVPLDEEEGFKHFFRVSKKTFEYICSLVREDLISRPPSGLINIEGRLLSVEKQVAIALRRLASGESQVSVGASFGVGQSTVSQVTWRFIEAMEERARQHLKWPDLNQLERIKSGFEAFSGLPNCCGAIDATHIVMTLPAVQTSDDWCDQENNYSMFVQGVVDSELRFLDIVTGWPGGMPISRLLKFSGFYKLCESGVRLNGNVRTLSNAVEIREYIVGGASYPLLPWLVTPFEGEELSIPQSQLNSNLETARYAAVKAFSQLKGGWRILNKVMWRPDKRKLPSIILKKNIHSSMASGAGKSAAFALLTLNFFLYFIVVTIASWAINHGIERSHETASRLYPPAKIFPIYYPFGNMATGFVVIMSLIAGVVGLTTSITGINNVIQWNPHNMHAAASSSLLSSSLTLLALGFACKEIDIGWTDSNLRTLETMLIILSGTQLFCTVAIHMGVDDSVYRYNY